MLSFFAQAKKTRSLEIRSGGQTGVDRAALDWAIAQGVPHGGWCPKGRLAFDGPLPSRYRLTETESSGYRQRTKLNVANADATLVINMGSLSGGTYQTIRFAQTLRKPHILVQIDQHSDFQAVSHIRQWLSANCFGVINIAGPSEEKCHGIYAKAYEVLTRLTDPTYGET